jgi:hypothetical protein
LLVAKTPTAFRSNPGGTALTSKADAAPDAIDVTIARLDELGRVSPKGRARTGSRLAASETGACSQRAPR